MKTSSLLPAAALICLLAPTASQAWWDTRLEITRFVNPPLVEYNAEKLGLPLQDDPQINGGKGGKATLLEVGTPGVTTTLDLKRGVYSWTAFCRLPAIGTETPVLTLTLKRADGKGEEREWPLPVRVGGYYGPAVFYLPIAEDGKYNVTLRLSGTAEKLRAKYPKFKDEEISSILKSTAEVKSLLLDRIELASMLPEAPLKQRKKQRNLADQAIFTLLGFKPDELAKEEKPVTIPPGAFEKVWEEMPDFNLFGKEFQDGYQIRNGRLAFNVRNYLRTGNTDAGIVAALMLIGYAERFPTIDFRAQTFTSGSHGFISSPLLPWETGVANKVGKLTYRGWTVSITDHLLASYDALFDVITKEPAVLESVRKHIPSIQTTDDLVAFLDERLIWRIGQEVKRGWAGKDTIAPLAAEVFGPGPDADRILRDTIFDRIQIDMTHLGGMDDSAVTRFSRDGLQFQGSSLYSDATLQKIASSLSDYEKMGGDPALSINRLPEGINASYTLNSLNALRFGNGFRLLNGDGGSLHEGRQPVTPVPSRILGSSGYTLVESGQMEGDPMKGRGFGIFWGGGRGHAHSDTLNLELVAHGSRMAPDLGGRDEGKLHGKPNMRSSRVHNVVEIDDRDFWNEGLSIVPATGWLISSALNTPGIQFTEHGASAVSHPQVSHYSRQTTLVDLPGNGRDDSYVFDVFRVKGGKTHSYNFHGAPSDELKINSELSPAEDHPFLSHRKEGTRKSGISQDKVIAEWPLTQELQKKYQGDAYEAERPAITRLTLLGQKGAPLLIGNAWSEAYRYNFPLLHIRKESKEDLESVYPAIIEMISGEPSLKEAQLLKVAPAEGGALAPVAVEVETVAGRKDLLFSSGLPDQVVKVGDSGNVEIAARHAIVAQHGGVLDMASLVGGRQLRTPEVAIELAQGTYDIGITAVDYPARRLTLESPLPASLVGKTINIFNGERLHAFTIESIKGNEVTLKEYAGFYKSNAVLRAEDGKSLIGELSPGVEGWDRAFVKGTVMTNEDHSKSWRIESIASDSHWMPISYPGYRWSFPIEAQTEDFVDANNDGRRTVKLEQDPHAAKEAVIPEPGELDILRADGQRIYFKIPEGAPEDSKIHEGGWSLNGLIMVGEDGRKWYSRYTGKFTRWTLQEEMPEDGLNDPNNDGKRKLFAFVYGAGDRLRVDASVQIRKTGTAGEYRITADAPARIGLPAALGSSFTLSDDGKSFSPVKTTVENGLVVIQLDAAQIAKGPLLLRVSGK